MNHQYDPQEILELLTRAREPDASDEDRARLNELLRRDERARLIASQALADEASLQLSLKSESVAALIDDDARLVMQSAESMSNNRPRARRGVSSWPFRWAVAIAAGFAIVAGGLFVQMKQSGRDIMEVAEIEGLLRWTGDGGRVLESLDLGAKLSGGTLELLGSESWARLEFPDGSHVTVSGQSALTISDFGQKEIRLQRGGLSAEVTPQPAGRPMLIYTPTAVAEVVGTRFNVVAEPFETQLTVNEGEVRVTRLADGSVQNVPEDHLVVASLEDAGVFRSKRQLQPVVVWKSSMPEDINYGSWEAGASADPGGIKPAPLLWKFPDRRRVLHVTGLKVVDGDRPPVLLSPGSRLRVRGRIDESKKVHFGLTTHRAKGGFSGKDISIVPIENVGELFDIELPLEDFKPDELGPKFEKSPIGLELVDWWTVTFEGDAGLRIVDVSLISESAELQ